MGGGAAARIAGACHNRIVRDSSESVLRRSSLRTIAAFLGSNTVPGRPSTHGLAASLSPCTACFDRPAASGSHLGLRRTTPCRRGGGCRTVTGSIAVLTVATRARPQIMRLFLPSIWTSHLQLNVFISPVSLTKVLPSTCDLALLCAVTVALPYL